jgi:putative transposase
MTKRSPFRYFKTRPEIIRMAVMLYVRYPLSLRNVEDLLHERGIEISDETIRFWWNRFGPLFAAEIRKRRVQQLRAHSNWQWYLDEVFVKINGQTHYLWRAVDHEGEVLENYVTKRRDRKVALKFLRKTMKRFGPPYVDVTDLLRSYGAAMKVIGNADRQKTGRWKNNRAENSHLPFRRRELAMLRMSGSRCHSGMWRTCCTSAGSTSAMRLCDSGGIGSARSSPRRSEENGFNNFVLTRIGNGIWTRYS